MRRVPTWRLPARTASTIHYCLRGAGFILLDDETPIRLTPHTLVIVPPGRAMTIAATERPTAPRNAGKHDNGGFHAGVVAAAHRRRRRADTGACVRVLPSQLRSGTGLVRLPCNAHRRDVRRARPARPGDGLRNGRARSPGRWWRADVGGAAETRFARIASALPGLDERVGGAVFDLERSADRTGFRRNGLAPVRCRTPSKVCRTPSVSAARLSWRGSPPPSESRPCHCSAG